MKKVLISIFVLFVIAFIALAVFIARFDIDRYRPMIEEKLETAIGKPVDIGSISLAWSGGIALDLRNLVLYEDSGGKQKWLSLPHTSVVVNFAPLLQRRLEVTSIILKRPEIELVRGQDGTIRAFEKKAVVSESSGSSTPSPAKPQQKGTESPASAAALPFILDNVKVEDAEVTFRDLYHRATPMILQIHDADLTLKNVSLNAPVDVQLRAGIISREQNILVEGKLRYDMNGGVFFLENVHGETDLSKIRMADVYDALPELRGSSLKGNPEGLFELNIDSLQLDKEGLNDFAAKLRFTGGRFAFDGVRSQLQDVTLEAQAWPDRIQVQSVAANYAEGKIAASGTVTNYNSPNPLIVMQAKISDINLVQALPESRPGQPSIEGLVSANFEGTGQGKTQPVISQTLGGQGQINVQNAVIRDMNVLKEILSKLSMIPGLMTSLQKELPESYQEKLERKDTPLAPIEVPFTIQNGVILFNRLQIATDSLQLAGQGTATLRGDFAAQTMLSVEPELSAAMIRSRAEMQYLASRDGRIELPLNLQSAPPFVLPDLQYIGTRLAASKTQEWLSDMMQKKSGTGTATGTPDQSNAVPGAPQQPGKYPKTRDILGSLLQNAMAPQDQNSSGQSQQNNSNYQ